jgi:tRNA(Ile)-lysidine synthase
MSPLHHFEKRLGDAWPPAAWRDLSVLVAVSGGPDSVALLRALRRLKEGDDGAAGTGRLVVGHVNHRLRPEADADEAFVRELARSLGVPCEAAHLDKSALDLRDGLEAAARDARYRLLGDIAQRLGARYVVTAHTADDQAETILHRIVRGTGLAGLSGMRRARPLSPAATLLRPMLAIGRAEVEAYLAELQQPYCLDATNDELHFARNRLRHELLPLLEQRFNPQVKAALLRLAQLAGEAQGVIDGLVQELHARSVNVEPDGGVLVDYRRLQQEPPYIVRELFAHIWRSRGWPQQAMGYDEWDRLAALVAGPPRGVIVQHTFPGGITARRTADTLSLVPPRH